MKSKGLFPHRAGYKRGNVAGGSAGTSSSNNKPGPSADGYKDGMKGWQAGRSGGGQSINQAMKGNPRPTDSSLTGHGGFAYDRSCAGYLEDKNRPADAYAEKQK